MSEMYDLTNMVLLRSLETARKSLSFRGLSSFFMANVRRREELLNSYGAMKRKQPGIYKHFIPTGLMCPRNFAQKNKKLTVFFTDSKAIKRAMIRSH